MGNGKCVKRFRSKTEQVAIFKNKTDAGFEYYSISIQHSYANKKMGRWVTKSIDLFPKELVAMSHVMKKAVDYCLDKSIQ